MSYEGKSLVKENPLDKNIITLYKEDLGGEAARTSRRRGGEPPHRAPQEAHVQGGNKPITITKPTI